MASDGAGGYSCDFVHRRSAALVEDPARDRPGDVEAAAFADPAADRAVERDLDAGLDHEVAADGSVELQQHTGGNADRIADRPVDDHVLAHGRRAADRLVVQPGALRGVRRHDVKPGLAEVLGPTAAVDVSNVA